jgi:hypothetical protein
MNEAFQYQRLVLAYHGCEREVCEEVLPGRTSLHKNEKDHDWLGSGIYFWEHGPERALAIRTPACILGYFRPTLASGDVL